MDKIYWMYLSLWNEHGGAPGLGLFSVNAETGELAFQKQLNDRLSLGCSCVDPKRNVLYVCNETEKVRGVPYETGRVYGYKISPEDGSLTELFCLETACPNPAYVSLDASGQYMVIAHHSVGGGIALLEKDADGNIEPKLIQRQAYLQLYAVNEDGTPGKLLDVKTQQVDPRSPFGGSHLHCAVFSPDGELFAVCDKGGMDVSLYTIDRERQELKLLSRTPTGANGSPPRYCVFHPTKPYFVVNHEHMKKDQMVVSSYRYTADGAVEKVCSVDVRPEGCVEPPKKHFEQQGLCISADGSRVYTCLNGPNTVCVLSLDDNGQLQIMQQQPISGEWPRGLAIVPGGKFVVASSLVSGDVTTYAVQEDGSLRPAGFTANLRGGAYMSFCEKR